MILTGMRIKNFRSLAHIDINLDRLNVFFGPNGAGKSSFLDTIWFIRDCKRKGVDDASSERSHGIGILWDKADTEVSNISITLVSANAEYQVQFGYSSGRIEPFVGESLYSKINMRKLIDRPTGSDKASFWHSDMNEMLPVPLREPEKLALNRYLNFERAIREAEEIERLLHYCHLYHSRQALLYRLRTVGSEASHETWLWDRCENLWSVLRNIKDKRSIDGRYDTIIHFMRKAFTAFDDIILEQTGPASVYASFKEKGRKNPIWASGISDGHLQLLILLTALFCEGRDRENLYMFDEPEISLHPWAIKVLAEAVELGTAEWNKQVLIATHSPILLSQFDPKYIFAVVVDGSGQTVMNRVNEIEGIQDLLEQYAVGSLYMAQAIAAQSNAVERVPASHVQ